MFSFGQFTHILPYLVLVLTSLAGYTTYAYSLATNNSSEGQLSDKQISLKDCHTTDNEEIVSILELQRFFGSSDFICSDCSIKLYQCIRVNKPPDYLSVKYNTQMIRDFKLRPPPRII
jgi:hypothetical protein